MPGALALPVEGHLPSLDGATTWLNSPRLTRSDVLGKVILIDFGTFTCINWIRTLPYIRAWAETYRAHGLVVIGVHTPEFLVEHSVENVRRATTAMNIDYPVAIDNDYRIWRAFENHYWPALYLVDARGEIRYHHFGEGEYEQTETAIRQLLADAGTEAIVDDLAVVDAHGLELPADWDNLRSPETYLGYLRAENFASPGGALPHVGHCYTAPVALRLNEWALLGRWTVGEQSVVLEEVNGIDGGIFYHFHARDLHLVMASPAVGRPVPFRVLIDEGPPQDAHGLDVDEQGHGTVDGPRLYQLVRGRGAITDRRFEVRFLESGVQVFVFTFG